MNRPAALVLLFLLPALVHGAGRKPPEKTEEEVQSEAEKMQQFNFYLDQGLSAYINEQDFDIAIRNFEAALQIKPKDPTARKALRLAKEKADKRPVRSIPIEPEMPAPEAPAPPVEPEIVPSTAAPAVESILPPGATVEAPAPVIVSTAPAVISTFTVTSPGVEPSTPTAAPAPDEKMIFTPVQAEPLPPLPQMPVKVDPERDAREKELKIKEHYQNGVVAYMGEDYSKAVEEMKTVLMLDPENAKARKLLMKAYTFSK